MGRQVCLLTGNLSRVLELPRPHQLGNSVFVADEGLHASAKSNVEVNRHTRGGHCARCLAEDKGHVNGQTCSTA